VSFLSQSLFIFDPDFVCFSLNLIEKPGTDLTACDVIFIFIYFLYIHFLNLGVIYFKSLEISVTLYNKVH